MELNITFENYYGFTQGCFTKATTLRDWVGKWKEFDFIN